MAEVWVAVLPRLVYSGAEEGTLEECGSAVIPVNNGNGRKFRNLTAYASPANASAPEYRSPPSDQMLPREPDRPPTPGNARIPRAPAQR